MIINNVPRVKVISFDIFDTLLYRVTGGPESVFILMQRELFKKSFPYDFDQMFIAYFPDLRINAPLLLRNRIGREASFDEIYQFISEVSDLSDAQAEVLKELELRTEVKVLRPIVENVEVLNQLFQEGRKVIITSDMYLSKSTLREFLRPFITSIDEIEIFVSSEYEKTKRSGLLYGEVLKKYDIPPQELVHLGDDWGADVVPAQQQGILAMHLPRQGFDGWEQEFRNTGIPELVASSYVSKVIPKNNDIHEVGVSIAGPLLTSYVLWVINEAKSRNIKNLFFLARDGYILKEIAKRVIGENCEGLNLEYLRLSRFSVVTASYCVNWSEDTWNFVFLEVPTVKFADVAARLLLNTEELYRVIKEAGYGGVVPDRVDKIVASYIKQGLTSNAQMRKIIEERSLKKKNNLLKYLNKSGFNSKDSVLIDVGWKGTIQDFLYKILSSSNNGVSLLGFYFGLCVYTANQSRFNKKIAYACYPFSKLRFDTSVFRFLEIFTHANEPSISGYADNGEPLLADSYLLENENFVTNLQKGIVEYAAKVNELKLLELVSTGSNCDLYLLKIQNPDIKLANALGDYCYSLGTNDEIRVPIAARENFIQAVKRKLDGDLPLWPGAYLIRQSSLTKIVLSLGKKTKSFLQAKKNKFNLRRL